MTFLTRQTSMFFLDSKFVHFDCVSDMLSIIPERLLPQPNDANKCVLLRIITNTNTIDVFHKTSVYIPSGFETGTFSCVSEMLSTMQESILTHPEWH